ncbi:N-carbamoylputrescine amidase [Methylohalomonas lacus]|uniref:N-carbamoylputrescine amidase n=1 Tax=Methylohalomonas lacus TaxID=398773 RepID=A0AAE3HJL0_9GAMM|nr:carbon-nitrogen hydrolase [Methylohalomonas lacus]MCS3902418.1 N-carbamoylputrescine amidase [Methylohalomonas lacus]
MSRELTVAIAQHAAGDDDKQKNLARSLAGIEQAAAAGAQLVLLPELHATPYFCKTAETRLFDLAEPIPGPTTDALCAAARQHGIAIVGSIFERRNAGLYHNTAVVIENDGRLAGRYRKMHIPDDPGYYEKFYFTPGDLGFVPIAIGAANLGVLVCWDQWFPEAARLMALAGAELLIYPSAIGWDPDDDAAEQTRQREAWLTVQRGHAVANNLPVISSNRVGFESDPSNQTSGAQFWGSSFICGPQGEWLAQADTASETVITATLDLQRTEDVRRLWPYLRDRRIDAYGDITKRNID